MKKKICGVLALAVVAAMAAGLQAEARGKPKGQLTGVVNVNEAGIDQLTMLPGVGAKRAQAIREYAQAHPFKSVEELKNIKGIGDKGLAKLKPYLTVSGPTTAKWVKAEVATAPITPAPAH